MLKILVAGRRPVAGPISLRNRDLPRHERVSSLQSRFLPRRWSNWRRRVITFRCFQHLLARTSCTRWCSASHPHSQRCYLPNAALPAWRPHLTDGGFSIGLYRNTLSNGCGFTGQFASH